VRVAALLLVLAGLPAGAARANLPTVTYADDRVTASLEQVEVTDVLAALARASGAEIRGTPANPRKVTAEFDRTPLSDALGRLLGDQNFTVRYGKGGKITIVLAGGPEAPIPVPATPPAAGIQTASATTTTVPGGLVLPKRFARHKPVYLSEPLQAVIGAEKGTFDQIFDVATTNEDGLTRAYAMQAALSTLEREGYLRRSLFESIRKGHEGSLGAYLKTPRAIEMLEFMAAHSRERGLQKKANVLLERLRTPPPDPAAGG
jgi:hypothetical protein